MELLQNTATVQGGSGQSVFCGTLPHCLARWAVEPLPHNAAPIEVRLCSLEELSEEVWDSLLHLTTSPIPVLMCMDPDLAAEGLGMRGTYQICVVPHNFIAVVRDYDVEIDPNRGAGHIRPGVDAIAEILQQASALSPTLSPPSVFHFIIPKIRPK